MKQIIALQQYTDKYVSLYEGEIRNISNSLADELIEKGIVKQHDDNENQQRANIKNLVDGNASGSIRTSNSTAEDSSYTLGYGAFAEGSNTKASGGNSHAEGTLTKATGNGSHAEGYNTKATNYVSHAEGGDTTASGNYSHAEGNKTTASGMASHAEGQYTTASSDSSHVEGYYTTASGVNSHAEGYYTIANHANQHVFGEYNIKDLSTNPNTQRGNYVFIVGNGNSDHRSNAFAMKWDGTFVFADGTEITPAQFAALKALLN